MSSICGSDGSIYANLQCTKPNQRHRKSTAIVSRVGKLTQVTNKEKYKVFQQSRLSNKYTLTNAVVNRCFQERVEVELQRNRCEVFSSVLINQLLTPE